MKPEDLLEAMNDARDEYVEDMMALMRTPVPLRRKKPLLRTVLLAAALSCLLGATAFAVFRGSMAHREPSPTDEPGYYITDAGENGQETLQFNWGDASMLLHFDTEAQGYRHAFRPPTRASSPTCRIRISQQKYRSRPSRTSNGSNS